MFTYIYKQKRLIRVYDNSS